MSSSSPCDLANGGGGSGDLGSQHVSKKGDLKILSRTIRHNYVMLFMAFLFTCVAVLVIIYIVYKIVEAVRIYYEYYVRTDRVKAAIQNTDEETYDSDSDEEQIQDEYASIRSKMERLKSKYKGYNEEMTRYARNVLKREPDDLIDARILSREDDDYNYDDDDD